MRDSYHEELDDINACLVQMANSVGSQMSTATTALLDADVALADLVIAGDDQIDATRESIEQRTFTLLAQQQPVAGDLRTITTAMRIVADLERMGDLAAHIAKVARMRFPDHAIPQEVRPAFLEAGNVAELLITKTATVIAKRDVDAARELVGIVGPELGELFVYPGDGHLFFDSSLPDHDPAATELALSRSRTLLDRLG